PHQQLGGKFVARAHRPLTQPEHPIPAATIRPQRAAQGLQEPKGAGRTAESSSTLLKCITCGVAKVAPASGERTGGLSAMSVITTNCSPTSAPAAEPTIT